MEIQNVVTTADLQQEVDATRFIQNAWGSYDFERYGGRCGYVKDDEIQGRVTVFLSGKVQVQKVYLNLFSSSNIQEIFS